MWNRENFSDLFFAVFQLISFFFPGSPAQRLNGFKEEPPPSRDVVRMELFHQSSPRMLSTSHMWLHWGPQVHTALASNKRELKFSPVWNAPTMEVWSWDTEMEDERVGSCLLPRPQYFALVIGFGLCHSSKICHQNQLTKNAWEKALQELGKVGSTWSYAKVAETRRNSNGLKFWYWLIFGMHHTWAAT